MPKKPKAPVFGARRQGDIILKPVSAFPTDAIAKKSNGIVAYGEVTGHCHAFHDLSAVSFFETPTAAFVEVLKPTVLDHQEHAPQQIPEGKYEIIHKRELDLQELERQVMD